MPRKTNSPNPVLIEIINDLKKKSLEQDAGIWKRVATDLERPSRQRREVNLARISKYTKANDTIIVPGKVLGAGDIAHKLTIAAFQFSQGAREKLEKKGAKIVSLRDICKESPAGKNIRIIG
ncbi:50S ribosomal protein L18e [Candidatus Woesearchaeota archaeon]|nr:50S ribosomal protein L18e [Candidatus Woesearchaeota archaeon]MBI2661405.1 50S ribosomal protein L18e [Candidatus Woesearchaeota archaeon]